MTDRTMSPQALHAYKDATDNLMYLKREQVQITYYTWLLLAAVYILSRNHQGSAIAKTVLSVGSVLIGIFSIAFIVSLHSSMAGFRRRLRHIYTTYFDPNQIEPLNLDAADHYFVTTLLSIVCGIATAFTFVAIIAQ